MPKVVYLQKRRAGSGVKVFQAALAKATGNDPEIMDLAGYVQSHTLLNGYHRGELLFDAVEEFSLATAESARDFFDAQRAWK